jgi:hypothetical protein
MAKTGDGRGNGVAVSVGKAREPAGGGLVAVKKGVGVGTEVLLGKGAGVNVGGSVAVGARVGVGGHVEVAVAVGDARVTTARGALVWVARATTTGAVGLATPARAPGLRMATPRLKRSMTVSSNTPTQLIPSGAGARCPSDEESITA